MTETIKNFWKDEEGATALGTDLNGLFNRLATKLNGLAP